MMLLILNVIKDFDIDEDIKKDLIMCILDEIDKEQEIYVAYIRALFKKFDEQKRNDEFGR
ncbi:hypothetical protein [Arcobacter peruensis]|uniref:hypothetical protein n=1 Tax=Arcobacter peruensis TaxID=2320140 RepID=UPI000F095415|nr:hypothetical protein [Arcobacter peruensis]